MERNPNHRSSTALVYMTAGYGLFGLRKQFCRSYINAVSVVAVLCVWQVLLHCLHAVISELCFVGGDGASTTYSILCCIACSCEGLCCQMSFAMKLLHAGCYSLRDCVDALSGHWAQALMVFASSLNQTGRGYLADETLDFLYVWDTGLRIISLILLFIAVTSFYLLYAESIHRSVCWLLVLGSYEQKFCSCHHWVGVLWYWVSRHASSCLANWRKIWLLCVFLLVHSDLFLPKSGASCTWGPARIFWHILYHSCRQSPARPHLYPALAIFSGVV